MRKKRRNVDYSTKIDSDIDDAEKTSLSDETLTDRYFIFKFELWKLMQNSVWCIKDFVFGFGCKNKKLSTKPRPSTFIFELLVYK